MRRPLHYARPENHSVLRLQQRPPSRNRESLR